jgi:hypothetical protein
MATSTSTLSLDGPVPPGPSVEPSTLQMAAAAPLVASDAVAGEAILRLIGTLMMGAGTLAMLAGAVLDRPSSGSIVGAAVFTVIMGLAVRFPTMLQDGTLTEGDRPAYSTMRVVLLLVAGAFVMLTVKVGWTTPSLDLLKVDTSWAMVLGVVLGGKVIQSVTEAGIAMAKK